MARYIIVIALLFGAMHIHAQQCGGLRYQQRVFPQVYKTSNVVYGNAPSLPTVYLGENVTQNIDLKLDVFEPFGDTLQKRPLVILAFGGAFLIGSKEDEDMRTIADSLARRGYVTASINYRLGMNVVDGASAERAIYRALQDYSAAVRYFKEFADLYRIDTNYIYAGGVSAGGFAALHMALVDESDRPAASYGAGGFSPRPDLGCKDCSGNNYAHSNNVRALISYWGAIGDVNWIKPGKTKPLLSFHGDQDLIVPYATGYPFTALLVLPQVSGSYAIKQRYDQIGAYNRFIPIPGEGHNVWGPVVSNNFVPGPNQFFQPIYQETAQFLFEQTRPERPDILGLDSICSGSISTYAISALPNAQYCWQIDGGQIVSNTGHQVQVLWQRPGAGSLYATVINHLDAASETDTFVVWVNDKPLAGIQVSNDSICYGESVTVNSVGVAQQYQWQPASIHDDTTAASTVFHPTISGLTFLEVTDNNGCTGRDSVLVTVLPPPAQPTITQQGDTLFVSLGIGAVDWFDADSNLLFSGDNFLPASTGSYYARETAPNGCESWSSAYVYIRTGIEEDALGGFRIYPNPFSDRVEVAAALGGTFTLYNVAGAIILSQPIEGTQSLMLSHLPSGMYFYEAVNGQGKVWGKLLKE